MEAWQNGIKLCESGPKWKYSFQSDWCEDAYVNSDYPKLRCKTIRMSIWISAQLDMDLRWMWYGKILFLQPTCKNSSLSVDTSRYMKSGLRLTFMQTQRWFHISQGFSGETIICHLEVDIDPCWVQRKSEHIHGQN